MSLANFAVHLRQKLSSVLSAVGVGSASGAGSSNATAGAQLQQRQRQKNKEAVLLWAGLQQTDTTAALNAELRRAHIGLVTKTNYKAPKDPVVLCHGLFGFDVLGPEAVPGLQVHYWKGIANALQDIGCKVVVSRVGTVAALKTRAQELRSFLENKAEGRAMNLVAHSMGGLDCRYVITHLPSSKFRVNSLTTVATPHRGSSFMDWCRDSLGLGLLQDYINKQSDDVVAKHLTSHHHLPQDTNTANPLSDAMTRTLRAHPLIRALASPIDSPAFANLTKDYCAAFNEITPDDPSVHYASYAAVVSQMSPLAPLYFSHRIVSEREGVNDGLVSLASAKWGEFMGTVSCDHWQLLPPKMRGVVLRKSGFDSIGFYLNLATDLAERGY
ncbi:Alpha/Beta hydrolase protein [Fimicolochytrium jonesii]|uniref:Alpha/Beta hydrolase protein n=1 Tax=Fimicolochytrium jonesii TaxID=1396493 RepID=UPI0022FECD29|nr:Alpha/Beta hydrolase protein [Fimicolochytrium jonesii]KAI8824358.1 Alpha/Beta hydrolase protein [Fimicolochytrium jonesii]